MFSKKKIKAQNSRRFKRLPVNYLIKYHVPGMLGEPFVSNLKDLSAGGVKFWTEHYIPEGSLVKISFLVPPIDQKVDTLARVVRVRTAFQNPVYYVAVRFIEISQDAQKAIDEFVEYLADLPKMRKQMTSPSLVQRKTFA